MEEPSYNGAIEVFKSRGAKIISIPMLDDGIDIGILKLKLEKIKPRLIYIMPNFQNPTGISYSTYKKEINRIGRRTWFLYNRRWFYKWFCFWINGQ